MKLFSEEQVFRLLKTQRHICGDMAEQSRYVVNAPPPALPEPAMEVEGWIDVKDRLPKAGTRVFAAYRFGVMECRYLGDVFAKDIDRQIILPDVTHWMPLPAPPSIKDKP